MEINYTITGIVALLLVILLLFLIKRNRRDEKVFEKDMNQSDRPETHKQDSV